MKTPSDFSFLLKTQHHLTIDGALATSLETLGHNLSDPLWSASLLITDPAAIRKIHKAYFLAGANVAITSSYQASERGFREHCGFDELGTERLIKKSVALACEAREEARAVLSSRVGAGAQEEGEGKGEQTMLVAGSVGPYGAYLGNGEEYTGNYTLSASEFQDFHCPRIKALINAGCDLLALETMPSFPEISALCSLLSSEFPEASAWLSVTLDASGTCMADGTPLAALIERVEACGQIVAVGVNCVGREKVTTALTVIRATGTMLPLVAYPNSGEVYDGESKTWTGEHGGSKVWEEQVREWVRLGARMVGGCCRTDVEDVRGISQALADISEDY